MSAKIRLNGKSQELTSTINLLELLKQNDVKKPEMVSVQVNGAFVRKESFETTIIADNDEVDFVYFMGGGC